MHTVRTVFERFNGSEWHLRTSDLADFRAALGPEVLDCFCAVWLHADRLTSLITFLTHSIREFPEDSISLRRDFLTFYAFASGTLKELGSNLARLRAALNRRGLWDELTWSAELQAWELWANDPVNSKVRKQLAFHVDEDVLSQGLNLICQQHSEHFISQGDGSKTRQWWSRLAHDAFLAAISIHEPDLGKVIGSPATLLAASGAVEREFLRVLERAGLKPIYCVRTGSGPAIKDGA